MERVGVRGADFPHAQIRGEAPSPGICATSAQIPTSPQAGRGEAALVAALSAAPPRQCGRAQGPPLRNALHALAFARRPRNSLAKPSLSKDPAQRGNQARELWTTSLRAKR